MRTYLPYNNIQAAFWQKILMRCIIFCLPAKIPSSKNNWSLIGCRGWPISFFKSPVSNIHTHGWNGNPFASFHIDVSITHSFCPMFSRFSFERTTFLSEYFCLKKDETYELSFVLVLLCNRKKINCRIRWSNYILVYFSWLLDHVIYLKLRRELLLREFEQIHKMTTLFIHDNFEWQFLICSALRNSYSFLNLR